MDFRRHDLQHGSLAEFSPWPSCGNGIALERRGCGTAMQEHPPSPSFVIPTYRLREVGETVEHYDEHFWSNGHAVRMVVFDDSSPANQAKYYPLLEKTRTHNELWYVGPAEKEEFTAFLDGRLKDRKLQALARELFRPSYGGNRNCTLMYTLGELFVSADDDMRPYCLMANAPESLGEDEVCRGKPVKAGENGYTRRSFDILSSFLDVLGKPVSELPENCGRGEHLVDSGTDLETNATTGIGRESSLTLVRGPVADDAVVKVAQTFRSGTNDIDAVARIVALHERTESAAATAGRPERKETLQHFASNLEKTFYGFEPDFFQHNVQRVVSDVVRVIKGSMELWPTLVEICFFQKSRKGLPQIRVRNGRKEP